MRVIFICILFFKNSFQNTSFIISILAIQLSISANDIKTISENHINIEQSKSHVFEGVFRFNVHKIDFEPNDYPGKCIESPEFMVHSVTWKIQACRKRGFAEEDKFMVTLISVFGGKTEAWSCEAEATFKLLPKGSNNAAFIRFGYFNYDSVRSSPNKKTLKNWDQLVNNYMIDDIATMDVTIKAKPPNRLAGIQHASTKFLMRILNVNTLSTLSSEEAIVRGIRWKVLAMKSGEYLGVFIIANEDDMDLDYAWNVTTTFDLMSLEPGKIVSKTFSAVQFNWTKTNHGFNQLIKWTDFTNLSNKFVISNGALLQIQLIVAKPKINKQYES